MNQLHARQFANKFPGPFQLLPGTDGVDDTFDVYCVTTGRHIVSTFYWDERQEALAVAQLVSNALNHRHGWLNFIIKKGASIEENRISPGPFTVRSAKCDYPKLFKREHYPFVVAGCRAN